jgi:hypothetical protein
MPTFLQPFAAVNCAELALPELAFPELALPEPAPPVEGVVVQAANNSIPATGSHWRRADFNRDITRFPWEVK